VPWGLLEVPFWFPTFALVLFRLTGLMLVAPIFGSTVIPVRVRAALTGALAVLIFPLVRGDAPVDLSLSEAVVAGIMEGMIGLSIGLGVVLVLLGAEIAGLMVAQQGGLGLSQVYDPTSGDNSNIVSQIFRMVLVMVFLVVGGHRAMFQALLDTYRVIPLGTYSFDASIVTMLIELLSAAFILAIRMGGPTLIALFLAQMALGFLSRTMPQLNILTVGFPVRLMVALGIVGIALSSTGTVLAASILDGLEMIRTQFGLPT
jgi:flagellar biosynthetic protein FliR